MTSSVIAVFVDQWEGRRAAQLYRGHLSKFFAWACRKGIVKANPARDVTLKKPKKRKVYLTDEQYVAIKLALTESKDGKDPEHNNLMVACLMDLYYLLCQRGTDIRLLRVNQLDGEYIDFTPTKTKNSSEAEVSVPITDEVREVVNRIKRIAKLRSVYLLHDQYGQPFTSRLAGDTFKRACKRAEVSGIILKDVRSKAATDADKMGYTESQIQTALAHTTGSTTRDYIRRQNAPVSEVILKLPKAEK